MKKFILKLLLVAAGLLPAAIPTAALAIDLGRSDSDNATISLNHGNFGVFGRYELGTQILTNQQRMIRCTYDFSSLGGSSAAALSLRSSTTDSFSKPNTTCLLPKGAIIMEVFIDTVTSLTSAGSATIALSTGQTAADILTATAYSSLTAGSITAGVPLGTAATAIKLTADRTPTATIAVAPLTAGKFYVLIDYILSQTL